MTKKELREKIKNCKEWEETVEILLKNKNILYSLGEGLRGKIIRFNNENNEFEFKPIKNDAYYNEKTKIGDDFIICLEYGKFILDFFTKKI